MTGISAPSQVKNPYPGLRPFEEDESDLFFGRENQIDELLRRLGRSRFLAVIGTSGSGKSSLVRAGLLPALRGGLLTVAGSHWRIALLRPGGDPIDSLASALAGALYPHPGEDQQIDRDMLEVTLRRSSLGLLEATRQACLDPNENLLIVVDQFEELFRFRQSVASSGAGDSAAAFVRLLLEASRQSELPIHVLITMRSDFLGDCARFRDLSEVINDGLYLIPRMTRDQLRLAITAPAAVDGAAMTPRLVQQLLNDVNDDPDQLPVLQHSLMRTWHNWRKQAGGSKAIDLEEYEATGGMAEALSRHADEVWEELPVDTSGPGRPLAKRLFQCLTEKGPDNREIRRPTHLRNLCLILNADENSVRTIIEHYREEDRAFLMPPRQTPLDESSVIDISHESFIRKWQRLKGWVDEEAQSAAMYRRITEAARLEKRGEAGLWRDPQLQLALDWRSNTKPTLPWAERYDPGFDTAMDFLDRSVEEREFQAERERAALQREEESRRRQQEAERKEAEEARRRRWIYAVLALSLIVAGTLFSLYTKNRKLLRENTASRLATQAALLNSQKSTEVEQSLLLATEAMKGSETVQNDEALRVELALLPRVISRWLNPGEAVNAVAYSPDGRYVATANRVGTPGESSASGITRIMEVTTGRKVASVMDPEEVNTLAFSPNTQSQYLVIAGGDTVRVINVATGKEISKLKHRKKVTAAVFSPDGTRVATASEDGTARVMDVGTGSEVVKSVQGGAVLSVAFSPDGRHLVTGSEDHAVRLIELATGKDVWSFQAELPVRRVAFGPKGHLIAATGGGDADSGFIQILDASTGDPRRSAVQNKSVIAVAFSPDESYVATGSLDDTARVFRSDTGIEVWRKLHDGTVWSVAFSDDGHHLATASGDKTARVFETATGREIARLPHQSQVMSVAFSPNGERVVTGSLDGTVRVMESSASRELMQLPGQTNLLAAVFSADHRFLATGSAAGAYLTEIATAKEAGKFNYGAAVYTIVFSPDRRYLAILSADNTGHLIDLNTRHQLGNPLHAGTLNAIAFNPDNELILGVGDEVRSIEPLTGKEVVVARLPKAGNISVLAASRNRIAVGTDDNNVLVYDMGGKEPLLVLPSQKRLMTIFFSPDGRYLAIAAEDTLRLVNIANPQDVKSFSYHEWIYSGSFSADGKRLAIGGAEGMVRVIEAQTGEERSALSHGESVFDLAFARVEGRPSLLVAAGDTVYQELLLPKDLTEEACVRLSRNLSRDEWNYYNPGARYQKTCPKLPIP